jgi:hypothetical protein
VTRAAFVLARRRRALVSHLSREHLPHITSCRSEALRKRGFLVSSKVEEGGAMKRGLVWCVVFFVGPSLLAAVGTRSGDFWLGLKPLEKSTYVLGILDGMEVGELFSFVGIARKNPSDPCAGKAEEAFPKMVETYVGSSNVGQIDDGLDAFYGDYRNRSITTRDAIWIVLNEIHGTPEDQMKKMIESFRRNAN